MNIFKLIIVFYAALSTVVMAQEEWGEQVLYCADIDKIGFSVDEKRDVVPFPKLKYTIKTETEVDELTGQEEYYASIQRSDLSKENIDPITYSCEKSSLYLVGTRFHCISMFGSSIIINLATLNYTSSMSTGWLYGMVGATDISYGTCTKF